MKQPFSLSSLTAIGQSVRLDPSEKQRMAKMLAEFASTTPPLSARNVPSSVTAPMIPTDAALLWAIAVVGLLSATIAGVLAVSQPHTSRIAPKAPDSLPRASSPEITKPPATTGTQSPGIRISSTPQPNVTEEKPHGDNGLHIGRDGGVPKPKK